MTLETLATMLTRINSENPELAADEKVRRFTLILLAEWRKLPTERPPIAPVDDPNGV